MGQTSGALTTKTFSNQLAYSKKPPSPHSISYEGIFNQNYYPLGHLAEKSIQMVHYAISSTDPIDHSPEHFISLFIKTHQDGRTRKAQRRLQCVILLDVSGSMSGKSIQLAVVACQRLIQKLTDQDQLGLIIFNGQAKVLIPISNKKSICNEQTRSILKGIKAGGATSIVKGLLLSKENIQRANRLQNCERRIIMITDVEDQTLQQNHQLVRTMGLNNINLTIVGIGNNFKVQVCQKFVDCRGYNYFHAVDPKEITTHLVEHFDYTLFPCKQSLTLKLETEHFEIQEVYGLGNQPPRKGNAVAQFQSWFPSDSKLKEGEHWLRGMILCKIRGKELKYCKGEWRLEGEQVSGGVFDQRSPFEYQFGDVQQFYNQAIRETVHNYYYVKHVKKILTVLNSESLTDQAAQQLRHCLAKCKLRFNKESQQKQLSMLQNFIPLNKIEGAENAAKPQTQ